MRIALLGPGKGDLYKEVVFRTGSTVHFRQIFLQYMYMYTFFPKALYG